MDRLIILGLIGYLIYSNLPEPATEPPAQTVTNQEPILQLTTAPQIAIVENPNREIFGGSGGNNFAREKIARWYPADLESYNRYETSFRLTD